MEDKYFDIINRYLRGELSDAEKASFDEALDIDADLRENFAMHKMLFDGIQEQRRDELKQYLRAHTKIKFMGNIWGRRWAIASAAIIAFFAILYVVLQTFQTNETQAPPLVQRDVKTDGNVKEEYNTEEAPAAKGLEQRAPVIPTPNENEELALADKQTPPDTKDKIDLNLERKPDLEKAASQKQESSMDEFKTKTEIKIGEGFLLVSVLQTPQFKESQTKTTPKKEKETSADVVGSEEIQVEYWVSPVGFKGYKLSNDLLILYGLNQNSGLKMYRIGKQLILREGFNTYNLQADGRYREYERVVNPEILQLIPD